MGAISPRARETATRIPMNPSKEGRGEPNGRPCVAPKLPSLARQTPTHTLQAKHSALGSTGHTTGRQSTLLSWGTQGRTKHPPPGECCLQCAAPQTTSMSPPTPHWMRGSCMAERSCRASWRGQAQGWTCIPEAGSPHLALQGLQPETLWL